MGGGDGDRALRRGGDQRGVLGEDARWRSEGPEASRRRGGPRSPRRAARRRSARPFDVDDHQVSIAHRGDGSAGSGLGRDVAHHQPAGGAAEAAIGEQGHLLAQALPDQRRGDAEHLAHPRAPARSLVADDHARRPGGCCPRGRRRTRPPRARTPAPVPGGSAARGPDIFTTQPSGARFPRRMTRPPVGLTGSVSGRTTRWPGVSRAPGRMVRPAPAVDGQRLAVELPGSEQALRPATERLRPGPCPPPRTSPRA